MNTFLVSLPVLTALVIGLTACSTLSMSRSEQSGYANLENRTSTVQEYYQEKMASAVTAAKEEMGIPLNRQMTEEESEAVRARLLVKKLESRLQTEQDQRQYYAYKPYFQSDAQRIQFLKLPSRHAREQFANQVGVATAQSKFDNWTQNLIENNDVTRGMSREAVRQSWGEPDAVEAAGNSILGNERWIYRKLVSTADGYKQETRVIYFESGRVAGWETE